MDIWSVLYHDIINSAARTACSIHVDGALRRPEVREAQGDVD